MMRFRYTGPAPTGFSAIEREVAPGEEFEVPEHLAVSFAQHGHCECLEPARLAELIAALPDEQAQGLQPLLEALRELGPAASSAAAAVAGVAEASKRSKKSTSDPAAAD